MDALEEFRERLRYATADELMRMAAYHGAGIASVLSARELESRKRMAIAAARAAARAAQEERFTQICTETEERR
jgi:hypothetical protein